MLGLTCCKVDKWLIMIAVVVAGLAGVASMVMKAMVDLAYVDGGVLFEDYVDFVGTRMQYEQLTRILI